MTTTASIGPVTSDNNIPKEGQFLKYGNNIDDTSNEDLDITISLATGLNGEISSALNIRVVTM